MSDVKPKYIKVKSLKEANDNAELYSLREPIVYTYQREINGKVGGIQTDVEYLMSLREESKYDNAEKFKKVDITYEEQDVPSGWEMIHHTSKEVILLKKGKQPRLSVIRELLTHIFQIAEANDEKDPSIMDQIYKLSDKALSELDNPNPVETQ